MKNDRGTYEEESLGNQNTRSTVEDKGFDYNFGNHLYRRRQLLQIHK